jgi:putative metallohydrolase (TIGR04338 family)
MRDNQRSRIYAAERVLFASGLSDPLVTVPEMQAYAERVISSAWWRKQWPHTRSVTITDGRSRRRGNCCPTMTGWRIAMPRWTRHTGYLLHELAHTTSSDRHGPRFARNYLLLVKRYMGVEAFDVLIESFRLNGVDWEGSVL